MNLDNDFMKYDMMNMRLVNSNNMVELPKYCTVEGDERFAVVAINEGAAQIVPLSAYAEKCEELKDLMENGEDSETKNSSEKELREILSATICQVEAIEMNYTSSGSKTYGIKVDQFSGFLDDSGQYGTKCVIFQNVGGRLIMHYGRESYKNNIAKQAKGKPM